MSCLADKVAIVTGSSRGLGRAIARELADHGCKVALNYYTNKEAADELLAELKGKGQEAILVQAGVAHPDDCNRLIEETVKRFGGVDILVNNAGVNRDRTIRRMSVEEWNEVIATDLNSIFYCTYAAVPHMIERGGGASSTCHRSSGRWGTWGSRTTRRRRPASSASRSRRRRSSRSSTSPVNALCPGFIETEMVTNLTEDVQKALIAKVPLGRFGRPEEVAAICRFLVTEGEYITGAQININGGMYMQ